MRHIATLPRRRACRGTRWLYDPYYPRYGNSQSYYSQSGYGYAPSGYSYVPASNSSYSSRSDYYRNYNGIHAAPERTFP
jgi:hypothetical protein